jgi:hypothetical protein
MGFFRRKLRTLVAAETRKSERRRKIAVIKPDSVTAQEEVNRTRPSSSSARDKLREKESGNPAVKGKIHKSRRFCDADSIYSMDN